MIVALVYTRLVQALPLQSSREPRRLLCVGLFLTALALWITAFSLRSIDPIAAHNLLDYWRVFGNIALILAVVFTATALLLPVVEKKASGLVPAWKSRHSILLLSVLCVLQCILLFALSNRQFGAFDMSVLVDTLWREAMGQIPYSGYVTTNPPLFILGLKLAVFLFGATWNAQALMLCLFSIVTTFWTYWLLRALSLSRPIAFLLTIHSQVAGLMLISFWWFNSTTAIVSGLFFLSALAILKTSPSVSIQLSYLGSFAMLVLCKPNTAPLLTGGAFLLLLASSDRIRIAVLSLMGGALSLLILVANHIHPTDVLHIYRKIAKYRGISSVGFSMSQFSTAEAAFLLLCLATVLIPLSVRTWRSIHGKNFTETAQYCLILLSASVGFFCMYTDGDFWDVSLPPLVLAFGVVAFDRKWTNRSFQLYYIALLCAMTTAELYKAEIRLRVNIVGTYFGMPRVPVPNHFFSHMRTGVAMSNMLSQINAAVHACPSPIFMGPRLEWAYAALNQPSPDHLPVFYQAGTSYDPVDTPALLQTWEDHHFATVIQGKHDWVFAPEELIQKIKAEYDEDPNSYPDLVIWHRKPQKGLKP